MSGERTCGTCRWWKRLPVQVMREMSDHPIYSRREIHTVGWSESGVCFGGPPIGDSRWPTTRSDEDCGAHAPKEPADA